MSPKVQENNDKVPEAVIKQPSTLDRIIAEAKDAKKAVSEAKDARKS
jgi:hypothetical protein